MLPDSTQERNRKKKSKKSSAEKDEVRLTKMGHSTKRLFQPLSSFTTDHGRLIDESFQAIGEAGLRSLLSPILQDIPIHELKSLCVQQLQTMDQSEIARLLTDLGGKIKNGANQPDSTSNDHETRQNYPEADQTEALDLFPESEDVEMLLADVPTTATCVQETKANSGQDIASNLTKMQMEILELELRARAIKALLRSQRPNEES